ncbi:unnamed protein product [Psylliodes chrysocephalus]|uniref:Carboxylic ester hydrolase n=1 Tax=Psylliodes chrysocephalus TaxID=3402493 RepID=A0A9P0GE78_9CUCU|nr:unnamed protein product [Psylliodes chrysocephala]
MLILNVLVLVLLGVAFCSAYEDRSILVETSNGVVQGSYGQRSTGNRKLLYWFRGIPFAEPPVGDLRFEAPVAKKNWTGILDARKKQPECIQGANPPVGSEDCLYLKVYTDKKPHPKNNLPVLVWIYGGAFFGGSVDFDDHSPDYLLDQDVIIVAIHYRVGLLGFLSLGDTVAPGNNGIRDQIMALKWIKNNIKNFGGDPDNITVFGQSAGAASIAYLLQIEETKGLFSKAILNSGSSLSTWALAKRVSEVTKVIAKELKISTKSSEQILTGLKKINIEDLQNVANSKMVSELISNNPLQGVAFAPVAEPDHENAIITGRSHERLINGEFHHVPILMGYNSLEASFNSLSALIRLWLIKFDINASLLVPEDMRVSGAFRRRSLGNKIKKEYFGSSSIASSTEKTMRFVSDTVFERPTQEAMRLYSQKTKVYAYHFSYQGPLWGRVNRTVDGVGHTEDLGYLFDFGHKGSHADYKTRNRMVKLWTNFAKTGNPTPTKEALLQHIVWPANVGSDHLKYLEIDTDLRVISQPNSKKIDFWRDIYKGYGKPPYSTY